MYIHGLSMARRLRARVLCPASLERVLLFLLLHLSQLRVLLLQNPSI